MRRKSPEKQSIPVYQTKNQIQIAGPRAIPEQQWLPGMLYGIKYQKAPDAFTLFKQHIYCVFSLLYFYGENQHKEKLLQKIRKSFQILKFSQPIQKQSSYNLQCNSAQTPKANINLRRMNSAEIQQKSKMCKLYLLKFLQKDLQKVRLNSSRKLKIRFHVKKQRQLLRKAFLVLFDNDQIFNKLKLQSNCEEVAEIAASLMQIKTIVKNCHQFQIIQFVCPQFANKNLQVFIQINRQKRTYKYIKQLCIWKIRRMQKQEEKDDQNMKVDKKVLQYGYLLSHKMEQIEMEDNKSNLSFYNLIRLQSSMQASSLYEDLDFNSINAQNSDNQEDDNENHENKQDKEDEEDEEQIQQSVIIKKEELNQVYKTQIVHGEQAQSEVLDQSDLMEKSQIIYKQQQQVKYIKSDKQNDKQNNILKAVDNSYVDQASQIIQRFNRSSLQNLEENDKQIEGNANILKNQQIIKECQQQYEQKSEQYEESVVMDHKFDEDHQSYKQNRNQVINIIIKNVYGNIQEENQIPQNLEDQGKLGIHQIKTEQVQQQQYSYVQQFNLQKQQKILKESLQNQIKKEQMMAIPNLKLHDKSRTKNKKQTIKQQEQKQQYDQSFVYQFKEQEEKYIKNYHHSIQEDGPFKDSISVRQNTKTGQTSRSQNVQQQKNNLHQLINENRKQKQHQVFHTQQQFRQMKMKSEQIKTSNKDNKRISSQNSANNQQSYTEQLQMSKLAVEGNNTQQLKQYKQDYFLQNISIIEYQEQENNSLSKPYMSVNIKSEEQRTKSCGTISFNFNQKNKKVSFQQYMKEVINFNFQDFLETANKIQNGEISFCYSEQFQEDSKSQKQNKMSEKQSNIQTETSKNEFAGNEFVALMLAAIIKTQKNEKVSKFIENYYKKSNKKQDNNANSHKQKLEISSFKKRGQQMIKFPEALPPQIKKQKNSHLYQSLIKQKGVDKNDNLNMLNVPQLTKSNVKQSRKLQNGKNSIKQSLLLSLSHQSASNNLLCVSQCEKSLTNSGIMTISKFSPTAQQMSKSKIKVHQYQTN